MYVLTELGKSLECSFVSDLSLQETLLLFYQIYGTKDLLVARSSSRFVRTTPARDIAPLFYLSKSSFKKIINSLNKKNA